ncbi:helix-turn-helix domain-containing protein [Segatella buccae]
MFDNGRSPKSIAEDLGISTATIYCHVSEYQTGGIEKLLENHYKGD